MHAHLSAFVAKPKADGDVATDSTLLDSNFPGIYFGTNAGNTRCGNEISVSPMPLLWAVTTAISSSSGSMKLTAVFNAQTFPQGRSYFEFVQIHARDAATAAALKERDSTELNSSSFALTRSAGVELDRDPATWQRIDCEQRLPGNADFLLIEIGLKQMPKTSQSAEFAGHYVHDVRLTLARRPLLP